MLYRNISSNLIHQCFESLIAVLGGWAWVWSISTFYTAKHTGQSSVLEDGMGLPPGHRKAVYPHSKHALTFFNN